MFPRPVFAPVGQVSGPVALNGVGCRQDIFLFDLETLAPATAPQLDRRTATYLADFAGRHPTYLLTSLAYHEAMIRLPSHLWRIFRGIFTDAGSVLWKNSDVLIRHEHAFPDELFEFLVKAVRSSAYPEKVPLVLTCGSATMRVCLAGMGTTLRQRKSYLDWERTHPELPAIVDEFRVSFPGYTISQDVDASLLITPASYSSASVRNHLLKRHKTARLFAYLASGSAGGYAEPLCQVLAATDVLSIVSTPNAVRQLLSYEMRRMTGIDPVVVLSDAEHAGA